MSKAILDDMTNMFGRVKRSELKAYAETVDESRFLENIRHPFLVGMDRFGGEFSEKEHDDYSETMLFRPSESIRVLNEANPEEGIHESLYALTILPQEIQELKIFTIGRANNNTFVVPDYSISGEHAKIRHEQRAYHLQDLNSTNGTALNGVPLIGARGEKLHDGDKIKLGRFQFELVWPRTLHRLLTHSDEEREDTLPPTLEALTDAIGRLDFGYLKLYCRRYKKEDFVKLVYYPVLVGAAFFSGAAWQREDDSSDTLGGRVRKKDGKEIRSLALDIFPLIKNPSSNADDRLFSVGRSISSDLRMNDPTLSKKHARIEVKEEKFYLVDLESSNGTKVNAVPLQPFVPKEIRVGDKIGFGRYDFIFMTPGQLYNRFQKS